MKKRRTLEWNTGLIVGENARLQLPALAHEFYSQGRELVASQASPSDLHAFRLAAKRFRYTLEVFRPIYGTGLTERLDAVRRIQSMLGKRQDCAVLVQRLRAVDGADETLRAAMEKLERQGLELEQKFRAYWIDEFDKPGEETKWTHYLLRRPPHPIVSKTNP